MYFFSRLLSLLAVSVWLCTASSTGGSGSGVSVSAGALSAYQELKLGGKLKFVTYKLSNDYQEIVTDKTSTSMSWDDFVAELKETECRWAVYDFEYELSPDEGTRQKIVFISWVPDMAKVKDKMLYTSSKDTLRRALSGIAMEIQATDKSEISYDAVLDKAKRGRAPQADLR